MGEDLIISPPNKDNHSAKAIILMTSKDVLMDNKIIALTFYVERIKNPKGNEILGLLRNPELKLKLFICKCFRSCT